MTGVGIGIIINNDETEETPLPEDLVGENPQDSRGKRKNSGPLTPENGGTADAEEDFDTLTGGESDPSDPDKGYPAGSQTGGNGVTIRPGTDTKGPRIDIPANPDTGKKPETLHYPDPQ